MAKAALTNVKKREWIDKGPSLSKVDTPDKVRKIFYIEYSVFRRLRQRAFDEEIPMSRLVNEILDKNL